MSHHRPLNPAELHPGMEVGPWRIVDLRGSGTHGAVYLARGEAGLVALKVALNAWNRRFAREVELLSRLRCPAVPRLIAHGDWESPQGALHPYIVMEWLEGVPLYEWARIRRPSSRQVLQLLASLARALDATHSVKGVHRDVKGDNVLVRLRDGQAWLTDFGSGSYEDARPLTPPVFPPSTRNYRSPEAFRFAVNIRQSESKVYAPGPADDVFALGVTAYRLVTLRYPPTADPLDEEGHVWLEGGTGPQPARELNPRCCTELGQLISRMLSRSPEERGSAGELADTLEQAAREAGPEADEPLHVRQPPPVEVELPPRHVTPWVPPSSPRPSLVPVGWAAVLVLVVFWVVGMSIWKNAGEGAGDAGTVAVGDSALMSPAASGQEDSEPSPITLDLPSQPFPGQTRPDANGRCPRKTMEPINGGCWIRSDTNLKDCEKASYVYKGKCYEPAVPLPPQSTSSPDGGG